MDAEEFRHLRALEEDFWWFEGMREITAVLLDPPCGGDGRAVLDAGCGTGANLVWLRRYTAGAPVVGIDLGTEPLRYCRSRGERRVVQASVTSLPFAEASFDLVTSFDVFVLLPDEAAHRRAAREMYRVLRPGGLVFVRAAASERLRSSHDDATGAGRRYTLQKLAGELEGAGFRIVRATYANTLLLPLAVVWRLALKRLGLAPAGSDVRPLPRGLRWLHGTLRAALRSEARWLRRHASRLPIGLSVICVARKAG